MSKKAVAAVFLFVALGMIHLMLSSRIVRTGYETGSLQKKLEGLRNQNRNLAAQVSKQECLGRIENIAKNKMKMALPDRINYIIVSSESPSR
jgi:cell division protein FtsL